MHEELGQENITDILDMLSEDHRAANVELTDDAVALWSGRIVADSVKQQEGISAIIARHRRAWRADLSLEPLENAK